jgi:TRAP-type uncharacterized transport system substrate-binding protein
MITLKNSFAFFLGMMLFLSGCTPAVSTEEAEPTRQLVTSTPAGPYKFIIASGTSDSQWFDMGNGLVSLFNDQVPFIQVSTKGTKNLISNVDLLTSGKAELAIVYDYHVVLANSGHLMAAFPDAPIEKITIKCGTEIERPMFPNYGEHARIVLPLYEQPLFIIASDASGIELLTDLKGKHVATGEIDSATEQQARFVVNGLGMDWDDDIVHESFDISTAINALRNDQIDALFWSGDKDDQNISNLLTTPDTHIVLIPINDFDAQKIMDAEPGIFHQITISGGSLAGAPDDVSTLAVTVVLATMEDFPAAHVQEMLSVIFSDHQLPNTLKNSLPASPDAALLMLNESSRTYLHPGLLNFLAQ